MPKADEPVLGTPFDLAPPQESEEPPVADRIRRLVEGERYGVLCTQGGGQPYGSMVAFACTVDLCTLVFATPIATRKFRLLSECDRVALLIDNRARVPYELTRIEAVTVTGHAVRPEARGEHERWAALLIGRHPHLRTFVEAPTSALFRVDAVRYLHVSRFQEVRQWIPTPS